jgi:hypothetical protein
MSTDSYLLAGKARELERLQLWSRMVEPAGRRLLGELGDGQGARVLTSAAARWAGCGCSANGSAPTGRSSGPTSKTRCWPPPGSS